MPTQLELFEHLARTGVLRKSRPRGSAVDGGPTGAPPQASVETPPRGVLPLNSYRINPASRLYRAQNLISHSHRLDYRLLRRVAEKAWLINTIIGHQTNKVREFLRPSANNNDPGFQVVLKDGKRKPTDAERKAGMGLEKWLMRTGEPDRGREDTLVEFGTKFIRDVYTLDQVATEIQPRLNGRPFAFWAIDPATITRADIGGYLSDGDVRFVQEIDTIVKATYTADQMVFGYQNARSDVDFFGYGYSKVEQAVELILTFINSFAYNAGAFTDDRLPRGMLLLNGDADAGELEEIEDYIISLMQGGPNSKWKIPIIPSGGDGNQRKLEWVSFQNSNRDMEYGQWTEATWTSVAALFDTDLEEMGIRTSKSTSVIGDNVAGKIQFSKSRGLSANLSFLGAHLDKIIDRVDERFRIKWTGLEPEDVKAKDASRQAEISTFRSIDEVRAEDDLKPYKQPWSEMPLNPVAVQIMQMTQQQGQQGVQAQDNQNPQGNDATTGYPDQYRKLMMDNDDDEGDDQEGATSQGDEADEGQQNKQPKKDIWSQIQKSHTETVELVV